MTEEHPEGFEPEPVPEDPPPPENQYKIVFEASGAVGKPEEESEGEPG